MENVILDLNGKWEISYLDNREFLTLASEPKTVAQMRALGKHLKANVPSDFYYELFQNRVMPDPFFGNQAWAYQKFEYTHVWYYKEFTVNAGDPKRLYFDFEGLDTRTEIYLNGELIGKTENAFIPHKIKATGIRKGNNEIVIHFIPVMLAARQKRLPVMCNTLFYSYEALYTRKPMHAYGWDIMPRMLSCGIFRPVTLKEEKKDYIAEAFLYTLGVDAERKRAKVRFYFALSLDADSPREYRITVDGVCGNSTFHDECCPRHTEYNRLAFWIENCRLWWPKNQGEQNLYDVTVRLYHGEELCDIKTLRLGIRSITLSRTDSVKNNAGDFTFHVNGRPIFCLGTNWVPTSPYPSQESKRVPLALQALDDLGCNMVRIWGGGMYPDHEFYDFCDEHGIMVWQDFALACAVYPQDSEFCRMIEEEATVIVKKLRQHPSLALWAGDNECDCTCESWTGYRRDPNDNILTRSILPNVIRMHDFTREYLPSSPFISEESYREKLPSPEAHLWGDRIWFKSDFYKENPCYFASEIGYCGCPEPETLKKFIGEDHLYPIEDEKGNVDLHWLAHTTESQDDGEIAYRYRAHLHQTEVKTLFGALPDNIETYSKMSQISQAEAYKYFIESFRAKKWRRSGILWWNLTDGFPQVSETVMDYCGKKKRSYAYVKRAQLPVCMLFDEPENNKMMLIATNDSIEDADLSFRVKTVPEGTLLAAGTLHLPKNEKVAIGEIPAQAEKYQMYLIEWEKDGKLFRNHYCTGLRGMSLDRYLSDIDACGFTE